MPTDPNLSLTREPRVRVPADLAERIPVDCIELASGAGRLCDVSRSGLRLVATGEARPDDRVSLALPGEGGRTTVVDAVVRWWQPAAEGPSQGGLRILPDSLHAWHELLEIHVAPAVDAPERLLAPAPSEDAPGVLLIGPDPEARARLSARIAGAGLAVRLANAAEAPPVPAEAQVVVAGPYRRAGDAREALALLLGRRELDRSVVLLLVPGASVGDRRSLLEAGAFDVLTETDGGAALDLRLIVALRLTETRRRTRVETDRLVDMSSRDPLTGLANRRQFLALAAEERRRAQREGEPMALLLLDLDHFKHVNDLYGRSAGDAALRALARLLRRHLRPFDVVARYGGEEFAILLSGASAQGALMAAERIRTLIASTPFDVQGIVRLTASIGVVSSDLPDEVPFATLLASADRALYRAKHSGRNQVRSVVLGAGSNGRREANRKSPSPHAAAAGY
jgi:diguanylate cyclase (GGDEF)-like protein